MTLVVELGGLDLDAKLDFGENGVEARIFGAHRPLPYPLQKASQMRGVDGAEEDRPAQRLEFIEQLVAVGVGLAPAGIRIGCFDRQRRRQRGERCGSRGAGSRFGAAGGGCFEQ